LRQHRWFASNLMNHQSHHRKIPHLTSEQEINLAIKRLGRQAENGNRCPSIIALPSSEGCWSSFYQLPVFINAALCWDKARTPVRPRLTQIANWLTSGDSMPTMHKRFMNNNLSFLPRENGITRNTGHWKASSLRSHPSILPPLQAIFPLLRH
jgi:hypothetical protein